MSALPFVITTAGVAALVNAQHSGTNAVVIAQVGFTATAFTATAATAALPGELLRLASFGGQAVAADTAHVTVEDTTAAQYDVRGFGLYLADGTLFGSYGQADLIIQKAPAADLLLAVDLRFTTPDAGLLQFGGTNFTLPPASETVAGVVNLATDAMAAGGTDYHTATTPRGVAAAILSALNARLGAGAPSAFVKGLLGAVSAVALRGAIGLKGAALYDPGSGGGLDADLLDGQHGAYYLPRSYPQGTGNLFMAPGAGGEADIGFSRSDRSIYFYSQPSTMGLYDSKSTRSAFAWNPDADSFTVQSGVFTRAGYTVWDASNFSPAGKSNVGHHHAIGDVDGLQPALDAKLPVNAPHVSGALTVGSNIVGASTAAAYTISANPESSGAQGGYIQVWGSASAAPGLVVIGNARQQLTLDGQQGFTYDGAAVWHASNFNPAAYLPLTGGALTGALETTAANGDLGLRIRVNPNGAGRLQFTDNPVTRQLGAMVVDAAGNVTIESAGVFNISKRPSFAGQTPWDTANFNPGNYQPAGDYQANLGFLPVRPTYTGGATHVIGLGWNGGHFVADVDNGVVLEELATTGEVAGKSPIGHHHAIADVDGLAAALGGLQPAGAYQPAGNYQPALGFQPVHPSYTGGDAHIIGLGWDGGRFVGDADNGGAVRQLLTVADDLVPLNAALGGKVGYADFQQSFDQNGYTRLPNGLILQWMTISGPFGEQRVDLTWPIAFPSGCITALANTWNAGPDYRADLFAQVVGRSATGASFYIDAASGSNNVTGLWVFGIGC